MHDGKEGVRVMLEGEKLHVSFLVCVCVTTSFCVWIYHCVRGGKKKKKKEAICVCFSIICMCLKGEVYSRLAGGLRPDPAPLVCTGTRRNLFHDGSLSAHTHGYTHTCIHAHTRDLEEMPTVSNKKSSALSSALSHGLLCVCV